LDAESWLNVKNEIIPFQDELNSLAESNKMAKVIINYYPENNYSDVKIVNLNNTLLHKKVSKLITNAVSNLKETNDLSSEFGNEYARFSCKKSKPFAIKKYRSKLGQIAYYENSYDKFYISQLDWINIDRLAKYKNKKDLLVNVDKSFEGQVVLKIKDERIFLNAIKKSNTKYKFFNVPQNIETVLVAIKTENEKAYLQTKDFFTDRKAVAMKTFVPYNKDSLNAAIQDPPRECACLTKR